LSDQSKKPHNSPSLKVTDSIEKLILQLRKKRELGTRRIQNELKRLHSISLSLASVHKVLSRNKVKPLRRIRLRDSFKSYNRPIPGDRVQMDTKKLAPDKYQYTAIDVEAQYDRSKERIQEPNYWLDLEIRKLKPCL